MFTKSSEDGDEATENETGALNKLIERHSSQAFRAGNIECGSSFEINPDRPFDT